MLPRKLFRSANVLRAASPSEALVARPGGAISRVLDLRSDEEYESGPAWLAVAPEISIRTHSFSGGSVAVRREIHGEPVEGIPRVDIRRISLLDKKKFVRRLVWKLPPLKTVRALGYRLTGNKTAMRDLLIPEVNRLGLELVYTSMLETSQMEIVAGLHFLLECLRREEAMLVMCSLGKDRTGLFTALVLGCCEVPLSSILDDYALSSDVGEVALAGVERMESLRGLQRDLFSEAPRRAMEGDRKSVV